jgi:hypothetical protein
MKVCIRSLRLAARQTAAADILPVRSGLPKGFQRAAPGDYLVEPGIYRIFLMRPRVEDPEVHKVMERGKHHLGADIGDLQFAHDQPELLRRPKPAGAAVPHKPGRLDVLLGIQVVDRVFKRAGRPVVILGRNKVVGIEGGDFHGPGLGMRFAILTQRRRYRFVEQGEVEVYAVPPIPSRHPYASWRSHIPSGLRPRHCARGGCFRG